MASESEPLASESELPVVPVPVLALPSTPTSFLLPASFVPVPVLVIVVPGAVPLAATPPRRRRIATRTGRRWRWASKVIIQLVCAGCFSFGVVDLTKGQWLAGMLSILTAVVFFAERDIYPGEEITYDYHFNHEDEGKKIPCFCNSKNCRRYLN